ncbi:unnamed protein product [Nezara viridula]|uniref:RNA helicase n=1 Tax=Nezara viridula TaxID=85310 RepID=A0A9P0EFC9_NEZVI|nr:unnamed protein product [Nezara viridula]
MWSVVKKVASTFGIIRDDVLSKEQEDELIKAVLSKERAEDYLLKVIDKRESEDYSGKITHMNDQVAVIDNKYYFHLKNAVAPALKLNDLVTCTLYTNELDTLVKNVLKVEGNEEELENFIEPVTKIERKLDGMTELKISGKIIVKEARKLTVEVDYEDPKVLHFNLDNVSAEFIPLRGDIVELECLSPVDDCQKIIVEKVNPKKTAVKMGTVTDWNGSRGVISNFAEFTSNTCEPGYQPTKGDKVLASVIRSDSEAGYKWRAIQVVAQLRQLGVRLSKKAEEARRELLLDKQGVFISVCSKFTVDLNSSLEFVVEVVNKSCIEKDLERVSLLSKADLCQITLINPVDPTMTIQAGQVVPFTFRIDGKFVGRSSEQYVWVFSEFTIGRIFDLEVVDLSLAEAEQECSTSQSLVPRKEVTATQLLDRASGVIMPGRRSFSPAAFVPVKLGQFPLSERILISALPDVKMNLDDLMIRVEKVLPCLKEDLSPKTYLARMHGLLYLEEVAMLKQVGELQMDKASFRKEKDCLVLDVPPLSPYTSKLVAGDMLIASLPGAADERKYEGVIHRVTHTELWLQFAKDFHDSYGEGVKYSVSFVTSRASLRRMHQAINLAAKHLGYGWLFPTGVTPRLPQVVVEEEFEENDTVKATKKERGSKKVNSLPALESKDLLYSPDPRKISIAGQANLSIDHKFQASLLKAGYRGRGRRYNNRDIQWNRQGSGYGMHCTIDNEVRVNIGLERIKKIRWFNKGLNRQQKEAVKNVLLGEARPLPYVIFGPPGTGKTVTVVETILQLHALIPESRLLVATPSNSAADLITERLLDAGDLEQGDLLRMVGYHYLEQGRIAASIVPYAAVPDVKAINVAGLSGSSHEGVQMCGRELLGQHRVTVGTLGCLGLLYNMGFPRGHFTHVIVDEAGQATEPELLIPMVFLHMEYGQVVLAGDPLQLGPVVTSRLASRCGLQDSLLARFLNRFPYTRDPNGFPDSSGYDPRLVTKLVNNYRSLPTILELPSMLFYDNDLIPNVSEDSSEEAVLLRALAPLLPCRIFGGRAPPLLFHGVRGTNCQETESHSWYNPQEVFQAFVYLNLLYKAGLRPDQVGIITPYQLQSNKIRFMLERINIEPPKVGSVEEFQGQEKMAIIVSVVRSSPDLISYDMQRALGFVANARRLNVALSRARAILIILGNPHLLYLDMHWRSVLRHCVKKKFYTGCDLPPEFTLERTNADPSLNLEE